MIIKVVDDNNMVDNSVCSYLNVNTNINTVVQ